MPAQIVPVIMCGGAGTRLGRSLARAGASSLSLWSDRSQRFNRCLRFDDLIKEAQIIIEAVTEPQARIAREAYRDFGKGSSHPAKLNFGDCFAYALAKFTGEPLLFKGDDFAHTDIRPAAPERGSAVDLRTKS